MKLRIAQFRKDYPELQPYQFISLLNMVMLGIDATTRAETVKVTPSLILSISKIYNMINSLHLKSLYGVDLVHDHKPASKEFKFAKDLYQEFKEYRLDRTPGKEYHLVQKWAQAMQVDKFFELVSEDDYRGVPKNQNLIQIPTASEDKSLPTPEELTRKFVEEHSGKDVNMAVVMYMVSAIKYFSSFSKEQIKKIAFDIAMAGTSGIDPNKDGYTVSSIEGKEFSGYHLLAYYYVSWALAVPEMLKELQLPFDKEFETAKKFIKFNNE